MCGKECETPGCDTIVPPYPGRGRPRRFCPACGIARKHKHNLAAARKRYAVDPVWREKRRAAVRRSRSRGSL